MRCSWDEARRPTTRRAGGSPTSALHAVLLCVCVVLAGLGLTAVHFPAAVLLGALLVGIVFALRGARLRLPSPAVLVSQAIVGTTIGNYVQASTLSTLAANWAPVLLASFGTLTVSLLAGLAMARLTRLDRATAAFSMIAGGATGIVSVSDQLGADDRLVTIIQYLRVVTIVSLTPVVAMIIAGPTALSTSHIVASSNWLLDLGFVVASVSGGLAVAKVTRLPIGSLLGPMFVAIALSLAGSGSHVRVPVLIQDLGYAGIGLHVGLRFTTASLRRAGRLLPVALALIGAIIVACALIGLVLTRLAPVTPLDAYLATTPGGIYAVLATAVSTNADVTFVMAIQVLRTLMMLMSAPVIAAVLRWRGSSSRPAAAGIGDLDTSTD